VSGRLLSVVTGVGLFGFDRLMLAQTPQNTQWELQSLNASKTLSS
jgi:hypothetical protein